MAEPYDPRYMRGIESFNRSAYFDAHEEWEALWQELTGEDRTFYQGLIQVAVCLYHVGRRNMRGASKLYRSSRDYLRPFAPWHAGLDLEKLMHDFQDCWSEAERRSNAQESRLLDPDKLPRITLTEWPPANAEQP
jgi:predicted metal-dependent hydrolase